MSTPSLALIKETIENAVAFVEWLAEAWRSGGWVKRLLFLDVFLLFAVFNPALLTKLSALLPFKLELPSRYPLYLWVVIGVVFVAALTVAIFAPARKGAAPADCAARKAIKGLWSFEVEDAEIFKRLQREGDLSKCLNSIIHRDFRFGVLSGESGCGKTSFLQAGLRPALLAQTPSHNCVYVQFTNAEPLDSIRRALAEQLPALKDKITSVDFLPLLEIVVQAEEPKPLVLLFDQFEQFFVHRKEAERKPFVQALADWYKKQSHVPVKVLVCVRGDFEYRLKELEDALDYTLSPGTHFGLKNFKPEQATKIFRVMAESEALAFDEDFVKEIAEQELATHEEGMISPVNVQILAWLIAGQQVSGEKAFTRVAYQKLGGTEGLLERFLSDSLDANESRRQAALKVLLALIDLGRDARAGVLTPEQIEEKLAGTVSTKDIQKAVDWLAGEEVRLITPVKTSTAQDYGLQGYELAHERLIPAVRRLAGKELSGAEQANQRLDRRVNEWLGNDRARRYLLTWRELRRIKRQKPYLEWGANKDHKEALIAQSRRQLHWRAGGSALAVLLAISSLGWWYSPWGQIWLAEQELERVIKRIGDTRTIEQAAIALLEFGKYEKALLVVEEIDDPRNKAWTLGNIARTAEEIADKTKDPAFLEQAHQVAKEIDDPQEKARILGDIARTAARMADETKDLAFLEQAHQVAKEIDDPYEKARTLKEIARPLKEIARTATKGPAKTEELAFLKHIQEHIKQTLEWQNIAPVWHDISDPIIEDTLDIFAETGDLRDLEVGHQVAKALQDPRNEAFLLNFAAEVAAKMPAKIKKHSALLHLLSRLTNEPDFPGIKTVALGVAAEHAAGIGDAKQAAVFLEQARRASEGIDYPPSKAVALGSIAVAAAQLGEPQQASALLEQARQVTERIEDSQSMKAWTLGAIAGAAARISDAKQAAAFLAQAHQVAEGINESKDKARALRKLALTAASMAAETKNPALLAQARQAAMGIENLGITNHKSEILRFIALTAARMAAEMRDPAVLAQARQVADESEDKVGTLRDIASTVADVAAETKDPALLKQALQLAEWIPDPVDQAQDRLADLADVRKGDLKQKVKLLLEKKMEQNNRPTAEEMGYRLNKDWALRDVVEAAAKIAAETKDLALLEQARQVTTKIDYPAFKAQALAAIAETTARLGNAKQAAELLEQGRQLSVRLGYPQAESQGLGAIAQTYARLGHWRQAREIAALNTTDDGRVKALAMVLGVWGERKNPALAKINRRWLRY